MNASMKTPGSTAVAAMSRSLTATDLALCLLPIGLFLSIVSLV
jgi:hypothetical protein